MPEYKQTKQLGASAAAALPLMKASHDIAVGAPIFLVWPVLFTFFFLAVASDPIVAAAVAAPCLSGRMRVCNSQMLGHIFLLVFACALAIFACSLLWVPWESLPW